MDRVTTNKPTAISVVIPADIYRSLIRNKVKRSDYLDAKVALNVLSSLDVKYWHTVTEVINIDGSKLGTTLPSAIMNQRYASIFMKESETKHSDIFYCPNSVDKEEAKERLFLSNAMTENFYSIYRDGSCVFVVVEDGFCHHLQEPSNKLKFLRSYFKMLSELMPVEMLVKDPLHMQYVTLVTS